MPNLLAYQTDRRHLRLLVRSLYDVQATRIQSSHRITRYSTYLAIQECTEVHGTTPPPKEMMFAEQEKLARKQCPGADAGFVEHLAAANEIVSGMGWHEETDKLMLKSEKYLTGRIQQILDELPIWNEWLLRVKGVGPRVAGGFCAEIDVANSPHVSNLWMRCGLGVMTTCFCPKCKESFEQEKVRKEHVELPQGGMRLVNYCPTCGSVTIDTGQAMRPTAGQKLNYVPFLKKHTFIAVDCFVKANGMYKGLYNFLRAKINQKPCHKRHTLNGKPMLHTKGDKKGQPIEPPDCIDAHRFAKAKRLTGKLFLQHFFLTDRALRGLAVSRPYAFGILGHDAASLVTPLVDEGDTCGAVKDVLRSWGISQRDEDNWKRRLLETMKKKDEDEPAEGGEKT